ncbi:hypothetical protein L596_009440 [Steinernema carpocapsae]|uniref:Uncharacterized protein n=1 Tax=Steinernema carpocapsae TaxID=34508 RepID=A0A4U5PFV6_STECR|nr:hypothetical protein L596_009440 [Steinernema carpocapsae]
MVSPIRCCRRRPNRRNLHGGGGEEDDSRRSNSAYQYVLVIPLGRFDDFLLVDAIFHMVPFYYIPVKKSNRKLRRLIFPFLLALSIECPKKAGRMERNQLMAAATLII